MGKVVKAIGKAIGSVFKAVSSFVGMLFTPKPKNKASSNASTETRLNATLVPEEPFKIIFGETALATDVRFWETYGTGNNGHVQVLAAACHEITSFGNLYLDEKPVSFTGENATGTFAGLLSRKTIVKGISGAGIALGTGTRWTANSAMTGCALFALIWTYDQEKLQQGIPSRVTQIGKGAKVYDPRRDTTRGGSGSHRADNPATWEYLPTDSNGQPIGRNNALQMLTYTLGIQALSPVTSLWVVRAGRGAHPDDINFESFIAAANACEVEGWYSDCILSDGDSHSTNEGILEAAAGGRLTDTGGRFSYYVSTDDTANIALYLTADDVVGELDWQPQRSMSEQFNELPGTFTDPAALFQTRPLPLCFSSTYYTEDGYKKRAEPEKLSAVQDATQGQKLLRRKLNKSRYQGELSGAFNLRSLKLQFNSIVSITLPELDFTAKLFRVVQHGISKNGGVQLVLEEENALIYVAGAITAVPPPSVGEGGDRTAMALVTGLTTTATSVTSGASGRDAVLVSFTAPGQNVAITEGRYKKTGDASWTPLAPLSRGQTSWLVEPLLPATNYTFEARHITQWQIQGTWASDSQTTNSATSTFTDLNSVNALLDEVILATERDVAEQAARHQADIGTKTFIEQIGIVDPVSGEVALQDNLMIGEGTLKVAVEKVDVGLNTVGQIQQPIPEDVSVISRVYNEDMAVTADGRLVFYALDGDIELGQIQRVAEATANLGHDSVVRRSASDVNLGGRYFLQKPTLNTSLIGDLAFDVYQSALRIFDATNLYGVTLPFTAFQPSIGGRLVVSTAAGTVTGDVGSTTALRAPYARIGNGAGNGFVTLVEGDATYSGRTEFYSGAGTRLGYMGFGTGSTLVMAAEGAFTWAFDKQVRMLAGAAVTGALTATGQITGSTIISAQHEFRLANQSYSRTAVADSGGGWFGGYNVKGDASPANTIVHDSLGSAGAFAFNANGFQILTSPSRAANSALAAYVRLFVGIDGKVGLNTDAPETTLHAAGTIRSRTGANGYVDLVPGDATNTGYLAFNNAAGTRYGYIGLVNTTAKVIDFRAENSAVFQFTGGLLTAANSAQVNGKLGVNHMGLGGGALDVFYSGNDSAVVIQQNGGVSGSSILQMNGGSATGAVYGVKCNVSCTGDGIFNIQQGGAGNAVLEAYGIGVGDAFSRYVVGNSQSWSAGVDNSDGDKYKIASYSNLDAYVRLTIDTTGLVGVNTASPETTLHVAGTIRSRNASSGYVDIVSGDATYTGRLEFNRNDGVRLGYIGLIHGTNKIMDFYAENGTKFRFTGGVLEAVNGATITGTLGVLGNITLRTQDVFNVGTYGTISETNGGLAYITGNAVKAHPTVNNQIVKTATDPGQFIRMRYDTGISFHTNLTGAAPTAYADDANQRMVINLAGNVGINTTVPTERLHVVGNGRIDGELMVFDATAGFVKFSPNAYAKPALYALTNVGGFSDLLLNPGGGSVGIGTAAPAAKLDVRGGGFIVSGSGETITGSASFTAPGGGLGGCLQASYDTTNHKAVIRSVNWGTAFSPLFFQANEFRWATGAGGVTERMSLDVNGKLTINGTIARTGADHTFAVDTGQGFHWSVNGLDVALLEASGRLSLNAITMGGYALGVWVATTPTPTTEGGSATGLAMVYSEYTRHGNTVTYSFAVSQTAINTATGAVLIPLPFSAKASRNFFGSGKSLNTGGVVLADANGANLRLTVANAYPMGSGAESLSGTITYQCV